MYTRASFELDGGETFEGYTDGRTWNGFACPLFTRETAELIALVYSRDGSRCEVTDAAFVTDGDEDTIAVVETVDGVRELYRAGDCWTVCARVYGTRATGSQACTSCDMRGERYVPRVCGACGDIERAALEELAALATEASDCRDAHGCAVGRSEGF